MKNLYFIRHGESTGNRDKIFVGRLDVKLTDKGRQQAKAAGEELKSLDIERIISSPLLRALETAEIAAKAIGIDEIETHDELRERDYGDSLEKTAWSWEILREIDKNPDKYDAESTEELSKRADSINRWIDDLPQGNTLIVGHGGIMRMVILRRSGGDWRGYSDIKIIPNAKVIKL